MSLEPLYFGLILIMILCDAHLDLAWNALQWNRDLTEPLEQLNAREAAMTDRHSRGRATVSLPELRKGGLAVVLATILARAKREVMPTEGFNRINITFEILSKTHRRITIANQ